MVSHLCFILIDFLFLWVFFLSLATFTKRSLHKDTLDIPSSVCFHSPAAGSVMPQRHNISFLGCAFTKKCTAFLSLQTVPFLCGPVSDKFLMPLTWCWIKVNRKRKRKLNKTFLASCSCGTDTAVLVSPSLLAFTLSPGRHWPGFSRWRPLWDFKHGSRVHGVTSFPESGSDKIRIWPVQTKTICNSCSQMIFFFSAAS